MGLFQGCAGLGGRTHLRTRGLTGSYGACTATAVAGANLRWRGLYLAIFPIRCTRLPTAIDDATVIVRSSGVARDSLPATPGMPRGPSFSISPLQCQRLPASPLLFPHYHGFLPTTMLPLHTVTTAAPPTPTHKQCCFLFARYRHYDNILPTIRGAGCRAANGCRLSWTVPAEGSTYQPLRIRLNRFQHAARSVSTPKTLWFWLWCWFYLLPTPNAFHLGLKNALHHITWTATAFW